MPVVATMAVLTLLGGEEDPDKPFTNSHALRDRLNDALTGETLAEALIVADKLETLLETYRAYVDKAIDAYISESHQHYPSKDRRNKQLQPIDERRLKTTMDVIALRQELLDLLNRTQWEAVFD